MRPDRGRVALRLGGALGQVLEQGLVQRRVLAAGADEAVALAAGELGRQRPRRRDEDRDRLIGTVVDRGLRGLVVLAVEVDPLLGPEQAHQLHRLAPGASGAPCDRGTRAPVAGVSFIASPVPTPRNDAPRVKRGDRGDRLRHHRRVVAQRRCEHARAQHGPLGGLADRRHPGHRRRRVAAVVAPGLEVVGHRDDVEPHLLGLDRVVEQLARAELLGRGLVSDSDRHPRHPIPDGPSRSGGCASACRSRAAPSPPSAASRSRSPRASGPWSPARRA